MTYISPNGYALAFLELAAQMYGMNAGDTGNLLQAQAVGKTLVQHLIDGLQPRRLASGCSPMTLGFRQDLKQHSFHDQRRQIIIRAKLGVQPMAQLFDS